MKLINSQWVRHSNTRRYVQVIEDAGREFQGGPEQALVTIAKSQLALKRGDVDTALALLRHVLYLPCLIDCPCHSGMCCISLV